MIPKGNYDLEPDVELSEEERKAKIRKMIEIKKMVAIQSLQQLEEYSSSQNGTSTHNMFNGNNFKAIDIEKEKKVREQVNIEIVCRE